MPMQRNQNLWPEYQTGRRRARIWCSLDSAFMIKCPLDSEAKATTAPARRLQYAHCDDPRHLDCSLLDCYP